MDDGPFYFGDEDDYGLMMSLDLLAPTPAAAAEQRRGSAFAAYQRPTVASTLQQEPSLRRQYSSGAGGRANVHGKMHVYLRSIGDVAAPASPPVPRSSRFRHIMRERLRRERLSQGFADLHALLPPGRASRNAKNFIVGAAADYIRELEGRRRWLHARNGELERAATSGYGGDDMVVKVRAESGHEHPSAVDVFEVVLRRLKAMEELRVTGIRSRFYAGGMSMDIGVESKIASSAVDKAITNALMELDGIKSGYLQDPTSSKSSFSCQVETGVLTG